MVNPNISVHHMGSLVRSVLFTKNIRVVALNYEDGNAIIVYDESEEKPYVTVPHPTFEWDSSNGSQVKITFCSDKINSGQGVEKYVVSIDINGVERISSSRGGKDIVIIFKLANPLTLGNQTYYGLGVMA